MTLGRDGAVITGTVCTDTATGRGSVSAVSTARFRGADRFGDTTCDVVGSATAGCGKRGTATRSESGTRATEIGPNETGAGFRLGRAARGEELRLGAVLLGPSTLGRIGGTALRATFSRA